MSTMTEMFKVSVKMLLLTDGDFGQFLRPGSLGVIVPQDSAKVLMLIVARIWRPLPLFYQLLWCMENYSVEIGTMMTPMGFLVSFAAIAVSNSAKTWRINFARSIANKTPHGIQNVRTKSPVPVAMKRGSWNTNAVNFSFYNSSILLMES